MISLCLAEYMKERERRQIVDIDFARKLWDVYDAHTSLKHTMQDICVVGTDILLENLALLGTAVGCPPDQLLNDDRYYGDLGGPISFLECFVGEKPSWAMLQDFKKHPDKWFADCGRVGGFFRGFAETSENTTNVLFKVHPSIKDPVMNALRTVGANSSLTLGNELRKVQAFTSLSSLQQGAIVALLEREYEGRLSHQKKLVRRLRTLEWKINPYANRDAPLRDRIYAAYAYGAEWFSKWQRKAGQQLAPISNPEAQLQTQRAREGRAGASIPVWIRPWIKVPKHLDPNVEKTWEGAGIVKWTQMEWDRLWVISQLYGLPPGATISGTTTDHMFTIYEVLTYIEQQIKPSNPNKNPRLEGVARRIQQFLPYLHIVPVIQMGSQMHHSIAEMGTALSLNDFISYRVGYYKSLLPGPNQMQVTDANLDGKVRKVLDDAEGRVTPLYGIGAKHIPDNPTPAQLRSHAAWMVDKRKPEELKAHRDKALLDPETAANFETIPVDISAEYILQRARELDPTCVAPA